MLHLLSHQEPLGTVCLQQDTDHVYFWQGYHLHYDTAKHGYSGVLAYASDGYSNSASTLHRLLIPMLLPFLRQEDDVFFQQANAPPHAASMTQHVLWGIQQLPWPARTPRPLTN